MQILPERRGFVGEEPVHPSKRRRSSQKTTQQQPRRPRENGSSLPQHRQSPHVAERRFPPAGTGVSVGDLSHAGRVLSPRRPIPLPTLRLPHTLPEGSQNVRPYQEIDDPS